ncbi:low-affinity Zn(2+) transporter zrt2 [Elasticomyces elasticus]|nr:low-affinity Zn(2+) transporter zrt2 [Elasticomyces elasticus]KAK3663674.1 low-affinity Zn(2+) transporter zrt2 [Elasticomyces elasticus]KAK5767402.1 low-affinity Zn(2+) transporter zrt2 [Elasticomyces elasticus]
MSTCEAGNEYNGNMGARISAIFVILVGSFLGAWFPVFAARHKSVRVHSLAFFIAKYFGSGVILATAFIHLLAPANEALGDECLSELPIAQYPWVEGICLMVIFTMFFAELMTMRYARFGHDHSHSHVHSHSHDHDVELAEDSRIKSENNESSSIRLADGEEESEHDAALKQDSCVGPHVPGDDHLSHSRGHAGRETNDHHRPEKTFDPESYSAQMTAIAILEFGVIFHSIFIGLTLAVAGEEFTTLYVVLVFHQTFEGLALGTRLASIEWPKSARWTPYLLGLGYSFSTPIAIAVGLGVRASFSPGSASTLIANGVFDSISAGILIYTGLIELMAHEFMFSEYMQNAPIREVMGAIGCMCLGAGLMALLGKWA